MVDEGFSVITKNVDSESNKSPSMVPNDRNTSRKSE
jgi:hypothetical protein